jgi:hypothetical protein
MFVFPVVSKIQSNPIELKCNHDAHKEEPHKVRRVSEIFVLSVRLFFVLFVVQKIQQINS